MKKIKFDLEKSIDVISKVCMILIPLILFYFGNQFKKAQDADYKEQQNNNRITTLLKSLSSDNALERKLAVKFSEGLAKENCFPTELLSVIYEVYTSDTANSRGAQSVVNIINQRAIAEKDSLVEQKIKDVAKNSPTRVYMQIPEGYSMDNAKKLFTQLKSEGFNMLGIERVDLDKSPQSSEVRYFKELDRAKAINISNRIKAAGINVKINQIAGYEAKIIGSQLEVWLK